jgi:hypothetical protein
VSKLSDENNRLRNENNRLKLQLAELRQERTSRLGRLSPRSTGALVFIILAAALLIAGNLLFWAGNTAVKTDRYVETAAPLIKDPAIQSAIATYATTQLYNNVDVEQLVSEALPPRADFLVPTVTSQLKNNTDAALERVLANSRFQNRWNAAQENAHRRFITAIDKNGSDGALDLSEVYKQLSNNLQGTRLDFLADKPLPDKVGSIQLVSGNWISGLEKVINNIDLWRTLAILLFIASAALGIYLSRNRRRTTIELSLMLSAGMFFTLLALRVIREIAANKVEPVYSEAAGQAAQIVLQPLRVQTMTLFFAALVVAFVAWISGTSSRAMAVKSKTSDLLAGRLHSVLFSRENNFTLWLGRHKRLLQWLVIVGLGLSLLFVRLTVTVLISYVLIMLLTVLIIEILSGSEREKPS